MSCERLPDDAWHHVIALRTLAQAWERVYANHGCAGVDGVTVEQFDRHLDRALRKLRSALASGHYRPLPLRTFHIPKPSGGFRTLGVPSVRDRLAQQAVCQVIGPAIDRTFEDQSFAYRKGRSVLQAIARVRRLRDAGFTHVLDADIDGFFDNVDHALLMRRFRALVTEPHIQRLVWRWLRTPAMEHGDLHPREKGLPQGAVISPMLANLFLDPLDESLVDAGYRLVRYADDFVVLCASRNEAEQAHAFTARCLRDLKLRLKPEKTAITSFDEGFDYLGATFRGRECILPPIGRRGYPRGETDSASQAPPPLPARGWRSVWQDGYLPVTLLAAHVFCPRAAWLRFRCGAALETAPMIAGRAAHATFTPQAPPDTVASREVPVRSDTLGLQGRVDAVEQKWGMVVPVEAKWSLRAQVSDAAVIQLAAEALCLEETWGCDVTWGCVLMLPKQRRHTIAIDAPLRRRVHETLAQATAALESDTPPAGRDGECGECSLRTVCMWEETEALREELLDSIGGDPSEE